MTQSLDNTNAITWFISFLNMLRVDVLDRFEIPGLGISYWDFRIGCAIAAIVITVLVTSVRIGTVSYADSKYKKKERLKPTSDGGKASQMRSHAQGRGGK